MNRLTVGLLAAWCGISIAPFSLDAAKLPSCDSGNGGITLPAGFCAIVAADSIGQARHLVIAPNGDVYVAIRGRTGVSSHFATRRATDGSTPKNISAKAAVPGLRCGMAISTSPPPRRWKDTK